MSLEYRMGSASLPSLASLAPSERTPMPLELPCLKSCVGYGPRGAERYVVPTNCAQGRRQCRARLYWQVGVRCRIACEIMPSQTPGKGRVVSHHAAASTLLCGMNGGVHSKHRCSGTLWQPWPLFTELGQEGVNGFSAVCIAQGCQLLNSRTWQRMAECVQLQDCHHWASTPLATTCALLTRCALHQSSLVGYTTHWCNPKQALATASHTCSRLNLLWF